MTGSDLVVPVTGELVPADDPAAIARALDQLASWQRALADFRRALTGLLVEEAQRQGTKTLHLQGAEVTLTGGSKRTWDVDRLLEELAAAGLPHDRLVDLVKWTPRVNASVARQLRAANPEYARILDDAQSEEPAPWRATVELAPDPALPAGHDDDVVDE
ncbi:MAG TPA: hypothetical protein VKB54_06970 [Solirubrobacteraceae bacterium]|nr:hypothetical protein [Solirubrobacteraceae bacterium]